jgi:hypothetical protein
MVGEDRGPSGALEAVQNYISAFSALEPRHVLPHFHEPCLFVTPEGVKAAATRPEAEQVFAPLMARLKEQDYERSDFPRLGAELLDRDLALVSGLGIWRRANGAELHRFGATYLVRRGPDGWKIAVAAIHAPEEGEDA